jgi:hypothetical protein
MNKPKLLANTFLSGYVAMLLIIIIEKSAQAIPVAILRKVDDVEWQKYCSAQFNPVEQAVITAEHCFKKIDIG